MDHPGHSCIVCGRNQNELFHYQSHDFQRCPGCGLVSTYPYPSEAAIIEHYDKGYQSGNYFRLRESIAQYMPVYEDMADYLEECAGAYGLRLPGSSLLDIGCFTGEFIGVLEARGVEAYGIELQAGAVEIARRKFPGKIFQGDVWTTVFPDRQFDIITMIAVIEHLSDPLTLLQRVGELLKPGGILLIETPDSGSAPATVMRRYWPPYAPIEHIHLFSRRSLEVALPRFGFGNLRHKAHWKSLPLGYVYDNFQSFSPTLHRLFSPLFRSCGKVISGWRLPLYGGEILLAARKRRGVD